MNTIVKLTEELIQQVRHQTNIVSVIEQYVALKKSGKNHFGLCPFHDERTASFSVNEEKQLYKCFSCGRAGDSFRFIMEMEQISFPEAVVKVAETANIHISLDEQQRSPQEQEKHQHHQQLVMMHQQAAEMYHHILLNTTEGESARQYLADRGFTDETIRTFQIGVAPNERQLLTTLVGQAQASTQAMEESGLFVVWGDAFQDRFYHRIMFPLVDTKKQVVGFSGRVFEETTDEGFQQAKYLNSPETSLFQKSQFLFNLNQARPHIRKEDTVVLCEGFMDVIALWQIGITNAVASMGTSLTEQQIRQLIKLASHVIIAYDGDKAGVEATVRALRLLQPFRELKIHIVPMDDGLDPDEMIKKYGAEAIQQRFKNLLQTPFQFYKYYYQQQYRLSVESERVQYLEALLSVLPNEHSVLTRSMYLNELSETFNLPVEVLTEQMNLLRRRQVDHHPQPTQAYVSTPLPVTPTKQYSREERAERQLLYRMLTSEKARMELQQLPQFTFYKEIYQAIYHAFEAYLSNHHYQDPQLFLDSLTDERQRQVVADLLWLDMDDQVSDREVADLVAVIGQQEQQQSYAQLEQAYRTAIAQQDIEQAQRIAHQMIQMRGKKNKH